MSKRYITNPPRPMRSCSFDGSTPDSAISPRSHRHTPRHSNGHTRIQSTQSTATPTLRLYLKNYLLRFTKDGYERVLPRKILNTLTLFRELMRQNDLCVDVFINTLRVLTCLALYKKEFKNSDSYIKVINFVNKEFRIPLHTMVSIVLGQPKPSDERLAKNHFSSKLQFEEDVYRLLKYYSFSDEIMSIILSEFETKFSLESSDHGLEPEYKTQIKTIHKLVADLINNDSILQIKTSKKTTSQFITHVLPAPQELLICNPVNPKPLIIDGRYKDTKTFLETHYHLLREDMIEPLRAAIKDYNNGDNKARRALFIYDSATFLYPQCDVTLGLMYKLKFNICGMKDTSRIKWDRSERLKFGTLLCIVAQVNNRAVFNNILWGIVADRNAKSLQNTLMISVKFPSAYESRVDFSRTYMMFESRQVYFESYCHTLNALHCMREIPFSSLLLVHTLECQHPAYIREETHFNLSPIFPDLSDPAFRSLGAWPDSSPRLDSSQYKALRLALTREVSLIQGPPGTGKTYVGAIALEIMLETKRAYYLNLDTHLFPDEETEETSDDASVEQRVSIAHTADQEAYMKALESPILILTYTNHALDQFLMLLLRFESKIVRIGSQVDQEELEPHTLKEIKKKLMPPRDRRDREENPVYLPGHFFKLKKERGQLMSQAFKMKQEIADIASKLEQNRVTFLDIHNLCSETQIGSICKVAKYYDVKEDEALDNWIRGDNPRVCNTVQSPKRKKRGRPPPDSKDTHSASDDEDPVDNRDRDREDLNDYSDGSQSIAVWDNLHQVLTDYEFDQILSGMSDVPVDLKDIGDLWSLSGEDRAKLYNYWLNFKRKLLLLMVEERSEWFSTLSADLERINRDIDLCILKEAAVVGMTTTGAARNSELIRELNPRIIVVEEAAEVLEAHIIAALTPRVQHLILIGDHQQLRPSCAEFKLAQNANLEVSLFERLVKNRVEHVTLQQQHRMRPEISQLISPIYPELIDHQVVLSYEKLYGVRENIFFINHSYPEDNAESDDTTKKHTYEAQYLAHLANYLINRGYSASEITILTFYQGQKFCILDQLRQLGIKLRVSTVDKYQGEENRVVLFSVVRSNKQNNIGHCSIDNRVCVALSRAKEGLIMIGNTESLRKASKRTGSKLWIKVLDFFGDKRINNSFPLLCHKHPQFYQDVHSPEELASYKDGVCKELCSEKMDCGHKCKLRCHYISHKRVKCQEYCKRIHPQCAHHCLKEDGINRKLCYERCGLCNYRVTKILQVCSHKKELSCHMIPIHSLCEEKCENRGLCGHICVKENGKDRKLCADPCGQCNFRIIKTLPCGHEQLLPCHLDPLTAKCDQPCTKIKDCNHPCFGRCSQNCNEVLCKEKVTRNLPCTHDIQVACHVDINRIDCHEPCLRRLPCDHPCPLKCYNNCYEADCKTLCDLERECGHLCVRADQSRKFCSEDCDLCSFLVYKKVDECNHIIPLMCSVEPTHSECTKRCNQTLACGHACELLCKQNCDETPCQREMEKYCPCGHVNQMECSSDSDEFICKQPCLLPLACGHICPLSCEKTCEKAVCKKPCEFKFPCGHPCVGETGEPKACYEDCGKCEKLVMKKLNGCGHELELPCSERPLHSLCKKACNRKKECGHQCTGLCGVECSKVECQKVVKRELPCKHVKKALCSVPLNQIICEQKCLKTLPCDHACRMKCYEDCTTSKCLVDLTITLQCEHSVTLSCHANQNGIFPPCPEPCQKSLPCGHACTGCCGDDCLDILCQVKIQIKLNCKHEFKFQCRNGLNFFPNNSPSDLCNIVDCKTENCKSCDSIKNNLKCPKACGRELGCGHKCPDKCHYPAVCYPCREPCSSKCVHSRCPLPCGDICGRCECPCEWVCPHRECTRECWEVCHRSLCNELCTKGLACGHDCIGLCGEICPDICLQCNPKNKAFKKYNREPLIALSCRHYFPLSELDNYFDRIKDSIAYPSCPECKEPICSTNRYGTVLKRIRSKINQRKSIKHQTTLSHIEQQLHSLLESRHLAKPTSKHLQKLFKIISYIRSKLPNYQLTKLYTMIDLLGILAGLVHHTPEAWDSHSDLLSSNALEILINTPTTPDDRRNISEINDLALMCEVRSVLSVVESESRRLANEDQLFLKEISKNLFNQTPEKYAGYFTQLNTLVRSYSIQNEHLCKFSITPPKAIAELEISPVKQPRVSEQSFAASPSAKKPKVVKNTPESSSEDKEYPQEYPKMKLELLLATFEKTKRPAPSQHNNQTKQKFSKIEFESSPKSDERKITIRNEKRKNKPPRWDKN